MCISEIKLNATTIVTIIKITIKSADKVYYYTSLCTGSHMNFYPALRIYNDKLWINLPGCLSILCIIRTGAAMW